MTRILLGLADWIKARKVRPTVQTPSGTLRFESKVRPFARADEVDRPDR
jgi:hypothetical protein